MKPLFPIVVAILVAAATAHPENIEDVKELPQSKEPLVEAEASEPQARKERCTTCSNSLKSKNEIFQAIKSLPNAEVHTQESFEGCSSEKGCAGLKVKDGKVIEKFGNLQAFKAAASADNANDFQFQAAGNSVFDGGVANGGPYWWMNQQNSPFKAGAGAGGGSFEKFSKSSSSFTSSSNGGAGGVDLTANPFLNGDFAKLGAGFNGANNFGSSQSEIDISKNQFSSGQSGFGSQSGGAFGSGAQGSFGSNAQGFGSNSQSGFGASGQGIGLSQGSQGSSGFGSSQSGFNSFNAAGKFGSGYTGSSPAPFTPTGSNVNLIQNSQKNDFDFTQQQTQQNIDEVFQSTGNVQAHDNSGGDLQQTCAGQGYICVLKSQCNNGVVNTNGGGLLQANTQKQYCNTRTEICCRIETASLAGAGNLQGSLGVGSATYSGNSQGSGLFSQSGSSQSNQNGQSSFGASGFGSNNQAAGTGFNAVNRGSSGFGSNQFGAGSSFGTNKFASTAGAGFGSTVAPSRNFNNEVFKSTSQSNFVETDSFSSGSENSGIYRPGAVGSGLKPGIPYLPPVDSSIGGSNVVSTAYTPAFVTTPRPFTTPRPVTTPKVYTTPKPTYLPPVSTKAPEYLPPVDGYTASDSFPQPFYYDGGLILDETLPGTTNRPVLVNNDVPSGCAAALKCTPIEFCTADGVISNTTVILSRDQEAYRVPLTDCKDLDSGRIGKCCRDPFYTDPWPTNQLGKWVPGVFGGNDGKYVPDSRGSSNNPPGVTVRPPVTGSVILNNFQTTPRPTLPRGPNQVTPGFPSTTGTPFVKNQYGQGSYGQGERGTYQGSQGSFASNTGQNAFASNTGQNAFASNVGQNAFSSNVGKKTFSQGAQTGLTGFSQGANTNAFAQGTQNTNAFGQGAQNTNAFSRGTQNSLTGFSQGAQNTNSLSRGTQSGVNGFSQGAQNTNSLSRGTQSGVNSFSQGAQNTNSVSRGTQNGVTGFSQGGQNTNSLSRGTQNSLNGFSQGAQTGGFSQGSQNTNAFSQGGQTSVTGLSQGAQNTNGFAQGSQNANAFSRGAQNGLTGLSQGAQNGLTGLSQGGQNTNAFAQGSQNAFSQSGQSAFSGGAQNGFAQGAQSAQGFGSGAQGQSSSAGGGNQVTSTQYDQGSFTQGGRGQYEIGGKGSQVQTGGGFIAQGGGGGGSRLEGQYSQGQGQFVKQGGGFGIQTGSGIGVQQGGGAGFQQGGGSAFQQGGGTGFKQGGGTGFQQGGGTGFQQGGGASFQQGGGTGFQQGGGIGIQQGGGVGFQQGGGLGFQRQQGQAIIRGQGQKLIQGIGEKITQEIVSGVRRGEGIAVQNGAFGVENEFGESIQRVYLPRYTGSGECGIRNPQKPYGNQKDLELDFAEIPWQAMVLLQTNRSLLCGGVITRPDVVITSASCVEGLDAKNVLIKGGEWKLGVDDEPLPFQIVQVKHIIRHPFFKAGVQKYDAAILVLTENLRLAKNIWPICLPSSSDTLDAFYNGAGECIVTGWGKIILQAHLEGSIMHGLNVSLLNPGECQNKINQDYPHLLEHYDQDSCACGQPTNPANNICKVDVGSALACTTGDNHYVLRGIYSWDSGCQIGNQLAGFYKFDLEWYEWAIGLIESVRFSQFTTTKVIKNKVTSQVSGVKYGGGVKGSSGIKGTVTSGASAIAGSGFGVGSQSQSGEYSSQFGSTKFGAGSTKFGSGSTQFGTGSTNFGSGSTKFSGSGEFNQEIKGPIQNTFSATYSEKKFFQTEPKYVTYTTKPEIVTFTTKPEYFTYTTKPKIVTYTTKPEIVTYTTKPEIITYTTKPKIVTYTTKPEIITYTTKPQIIRYDYQTSGSQTNQQIVPPSVSFNPSFTEVVGSKHVHDAKCKCLENGKK